MLIDLSEEFNLTPKYCSEVFNRFSGDNFKNYLNRYRINMTQKIITEDPDVRIAELASRVGFSSSNTFIRVFDRYMGVTPKQYADSGIEPPVRPADGQVLQEKRHMTGLMIRAFPEYSNPIPREGCQISSAYISGETVLRVLSISECSILLIPLRVQMKQNLPLVPGSSASACTFLIMIPRIFVSCKK